MTIAANARERHPWLDPFMGAEGAPLRALIKTVTDSVEAQEQAIGARQRKRRPADQAHHEAALEAIISNLAYSILHPPKTGRLAILTGNAAIRRDRYSNPAMGKPVRMLLHRLSEIGVVAWDYGWRGNASTLAPTPEFAAMVRKAGIGLSDFGRQEGEELILLWRTGSHFAGGEYVKSRTLVDYANTSQTDAFRATMEAVNRHLAASAIEFIDDGGEPVDSCNRRLRRFFVMPMRDPAPQRFDLSGRLYGGFWQNLKKDRRHRIRIAGEPVAVVDFSAMFPRLAYAAVGAPPPESDLYAIPGLEDHRSAVKLAVNTLLFDPTVNRKSWPKVDEEGKAMPPGWSIARFKKALLSRHPVLRGSLGNARGLSFMHTESQIMVTVLTVLQGMGITALPLHDAVIVPVSAAQEARAVMMAVAEEITSFALPVALSIPSLANGDEGSHEGEQSSWPSTSGPAYPTSSHSPIIPCIGPVTPPAE
ncbi:hypothetical protein RNI52_34475 [Labrys neptuniae]|uniref:hypothetical protein n=1 Tax=Labrys neptuniae TaxID=376174 RepID=UPI00288D4A51|nr:hypothetical protein [Labrys neptuniae]MDT3382483.1 hypothetical protein [Labrys neptuniae]